jgi:hypothetical protein
MSTRNRNRTTWITRVLGALVVVIAATGVLVFAVVVTSEVSAILANENISPNLFMDAELPADAVVAPDGAVVEWGASTVASLTVSNLSGFSTGGLLWGTILTRAADIAILVTIVVVGLTIARRRPLTRRITVLTVVASVGYIVVRSAGVAIYSFGAWNAATELSGDAELSPYLLRFVAPWSLGGGWLVVALLIVVLLGRRAQRDLDGVV